MTTSNASVSNTEPAQALFAEALRQHQSGQLSQAQTLYENLLRLQPMHADALHLLGVLASQRGEHQRAVERIAQAIALQGQHAAYHVNLGIAHKELGHFDLAQSCFERALTLQPQFAEAHYNLGNLYRHGGRLEQALACFDAALLIQKNYLIAAYSKGSVLLKLKQYQAALACFEQLLQQQPGLAPVWLGRGHALQALDQHAPACQSFAQYLALSAAGPAVPEQVQALLQLGLSQQRLGQLEPALDSYARALAREPDLVAAHSNSAQALYELGRFEASLASFNEALRCQPASPQLHTDRGNVWLALKDYDKAMADYHRALQLQPDDMSAHYNLGNALRERGDYEQAAASFERAWTLSQGRFTPAQWNLAFVLLLLGEYRRGWDCHESRLVPGTTQVVARQYPQPRWDGSTALVGKTLFVYFEQGLGDTIQFFRYARLLPGLGARVVLQVQKALLPLFAALANEGWVVLDDSGTPPDFDLHCPLMSLPHALRDHMASIPLAEGYLLADPMRRAQWAEKLGPATAPRIGLVWSGNPAHRNDANRSIALAELLDFLPPGFSYFSLHKELREADRAALATRPEIRFVGDELQDFADTAALVDWMDGVVSVDTSVAHLSGAMGKTTHVLLPHLPDWRWLLARRDSPWYASARLYRQAAPGDWSGALSALRDDLLRLRQDWQGNAQATPLSSQTPDAGTDGAAPSS